MRTFKYTGNHGAIRLQGNLLKRGVPFATDEARMIAILTSRTDIEEVKEVKKEATKPSRSSDAKQS